MRHGLCGTSDARTQIVVAADMSCEDHATNFRGCSPAGELRWTGEFKLTCISGRKQAGRSLERVPFSPNGVPALLPPGRFHFSIRRKSLQFLVPRAQFLVVQERVA